MNNKIIVFVCFVFILNAQDLKKTKNTNQQYLDLFEEARISFDLIRGLPIRGMNKDIFEKENSEVLENIMTYRNVMTNVRHEQWKIYKNSLRPYEIITKDDYLTYRKNFYN